jgi:hypothetical protein
MEPLPSNPNSVEEQLFTFTCPFQLRGRSSAGSQLTDKFSSEVNIHIRPLMSGRMFRTDFFDNVFLLLAVKPSEYATAPNINVVRFG